MSYCVALPCFEGPLDLLLHLIHKNELNIYDIPIHLIVDEYVQIIGSMQQLDMEVASEFLVMAAQLLAIKSRMLLPQHKALTVEEEIDPRQELVDRLLEYQRYQEVLETLHGMQQEAQNNYYREQDEEMLHQLVANIHVLEGIQLADLLLYAKNRSKELQDLDRQLEYVKRSYTITGQVKFIRRKLRETIDGVDFCELLLVWERAEIVVTFLALLELCKYGELIVIQDKAFGSIIIKKRDSEVLADAI
ncbi:MAG: segregation/condensation protein A [Clostridia bacterium]